MCGIFGCILPHDSGFSRRRAAKTVTDLYRLSETRGREASGMAFRTIDAIRVHREPKSASSLIGSDRYKALLKAFLDAWETGRGAGPAPVFIGHTRLTTSGAQGINTNNQPAVRDGIVCIHNGIIVNVDDIWKKFPDFKQQTGLDTEVLPCLAGHFLRQGKRLSDAVAALYSEITGTASIALLFEKFDDLVLASNTGSLYTFRPDRGPGFIFTSEKYTLETLLKRNRLGDALGPGKIRQIRAGEGCCVNLTSGSAETFVFTGAARATLTMNGCAKRSPVKDTRDDDETALATMRRCSRCILPETFPYISFDEQGVCNYCRNHKPIICKGEQSLVNDIAPFRSKNGEADCMIAFSGGRDSSYSLHYAVKHLGLRPIAYTYDWGMVNDLARRNQARITGKLGIEQIIVSADIKRKRENIGKNVRAWLAKPDLGLVPLFMAGDKQFFYHANVLKKRTGIRLFIWAMNQLERTHFKVGFCGISSGNTKELIYKLSIQDRLRLGRYYMKNFLKNPRYLNRSLLDTGFAFLSYYLINHDYCWFYDYLPWDEAEINRTLREEYDWETSPDSSTTWRVGDETAAFYNYIYYTVAGFTENDTFRSNQIREGLIGREQAIADISLENKPRYDSIREYLRLINVDFDDAVSVIDSIPKLYARR
jgi:glucosamine--fructose-6-phosphate aminotransferase (isomerizing)